MQIHKRPLRDVEAGSMECLIKKLFPQNEAIPTFGRAARNLFSASFFGDLKIHDGIGSRVLANWGNLFETFLGYF